MLPAHCCRPAVIIGLTVFLSTPPAAAQWLEPECESLLEVVGAQQDALFGFLVERVGDANGDGVTDFVASSPFFDAGNSSVGRVSCHSGATGAVIWSRNGSRLSEIYGFALRTIDDLTGDGVDEVVTGGPWNSGLPGGKVHVMSGANGSILFELTGPVQFDQIGYAVAGDGDFNGDGFADLAIGATGVDASGPEAGQVIVFSTIDWSPVAFINPPAGRFNLGNGLAYLGDVTGDGRDDLAIGSRIADFDRFGSIHVYSFNGANAALEYTIDNIDHGGAFDGDLIEGGRDYNNDSFGDIFVGEWSSSEGHLFSGLDGSFIRTLNGDGVPQTLGPAKMIDDIDGDGRADLIVGAWGDDSGANNAGKVFLYSGADGSVIRTMTYTGAGGKFGTGVAVMGDMNNDGGVEFLIGTPGTSFEGLPLGRVFIMAGTPSDSVDICPDAFQRLRGIPIGGDLDSLCASDNDPLITRPDIFTPAPLENPAVQIEVTGTAPPVGPLQSLRFRVESATTAGNNVIRQNILLWNFDSQEYDLVDQRFIGLADTTAAVEISQNPDSYIEDATGEVRALIQHVGILFSLPAIWTAGIDQAMWSVE